MIIIISIDCDQFVESCLTFMRVSLRYSLWGGVEDYELSSYQHDVVTKIRYLEITQWNMSSEVFKDEDS